MVSKQQSVSHRLDTYRHRRHAHLKMQRFSCCFMPGLPPYILRTCCLQRRQAQHGELVRADEQAGLVLLGLLVPALLLHTPRRLAAGRKVLWGLMGSLGS